MQVHGSVVGRHPSPLLLPHLVYPMQQTSWSDSRSHCLTIFGHHGITLPYLPSQGTVATSFGRSVCRDLDLMISGWRKMRHVRVVMTLHVCRMIGVLVFGLRELSPHRHIFSDSLRAAGRSDAWMHAN
jgi:hypothetical protein